MNSPSPSWQQAMQQAVTDPAELLRLLDLENLIEALPANRYGFRLRVPRSFVARMRKGDPHDPLLRQVLPINAENQISAGFSTDPVGDLAACKSAGLLHKYAGRVLLVLTGACAVHCRYCFRQHYPYAEASLPRQQDALEYIRADASIHEVILSGGDPLCLSDARLAALAGQLAEIPHLRRLRIHTRTPVVLPERVDDALLQWLQNSRLQPVIVLHVNHPNELEGAAVNAALARLARAVPMLLNQAVLLRGVNDDANTLEQLSEALASRRIMPYYLHFLDQVQGAAHFAVTEATAAALLRDLRVRLPGYLVPRLVREVAGKLHKQPM
jgi:EF-P beta-lysylation protein EpmB